MNIFYYISVDCTCVCSVCMNDYDLCVLGPDWEDEGALKLSRDGIIGVSRFSTDTILSQSYIVIFITTFNNLYFVIRRYVDTGGGRTFLQARFYLQCVPQNSAFLFTVCPTKH